MCYKLNLLITFLIILNVYDIKGLKIKLTKLKCNVTDPTFAEFNYCRIKAASRELQYITIYLKYLQLPINEASIRFKFYKRANGYKPFLYDFTVQCDFLKHLNPLSNMIWKRFRDVSNLNHSCPFVEDFEIKQLTNRYMEQQLNVLPLLSGDYALFVNFNSSNMPKLNVEFYVTLYNNNV